MAKPILVMRIPVSYQRDMRGEQFNDLLRRTSIELRDYHFLWLIDGLCEQIVFETHNADNVAESDINDLKERLTTLANHGVEIMNIEIEKRTKQIMEEAQAHRMSYPRPFSDPYGPYSPGIPGTTWTSNDFQIGSSDQLLAKTGKTEKKIKFFDKILNKFNGK